MQWIRKWCGLNPRQRVLLLQAGCLLLMARAALRVVPFRWLKRVAIRQAQREEMNPVIRTKRCAEVRWAVERAAAHLPGLYTCFARGLAAQAMLRLQNVSTTLYYGVASGPAQIVEAHVWVQDGENGVIGHQEALRFATLAKYPSSS